MNPALVGPIITAGAAFLGVLIASAVVPWIRSIVTRRESARYLAIRVVCILDTFVDGCATVAADSGEADHQGCLIPVESEPKAPTYPSDVDWRSIDYQLMYELLALPAVVEKASQAVSNAYEYSDPPDYEGFFETRSFEYATLGLAVFDLAKRLRKKYSIKDLGRSGWDPVDTLKSELKKVEDIRKQRSEAWEQLQKSAPPVPTATSQPTTA